MYYRKAGISNYTRRLVTAISDQRSAISLLVDRRDKDIGWIPSNCKVIRTVTPAHHKYEHLTLPLELAISNLQSPISLVHFPDFIACSGRFKKVITIHDLYFMEHPEAMSADGARYYGRIRQSAQHADAIIAVSHFTRTEILRLMPEIASTKITVIHEAADQSPIPTPQSPIPNPFALFVGTFEPRKNLNTLLRALVQVPSDFKLVIVGESGWMAGSEPMRIAQALGVSDKVHLAGHVGDAELDALYRQARFVLVPSLAEGFGLTALEAMARGTPVICSTGGSLPEVVGDAALLHEPTDVAQLASHITNLWNDEALRRDYAQRGQQRASQFTWAKAAQQTLRIYDDLLAPSQSVNRKSPIE
jgi:glycosyltransferase involved in cell wall biosynthesis